MPRAHTVVAVVALAAISCLLVSGASSHAGTKTDLRSHGRMAFMEKSSLRMLLLRRSVSGVARSDNEDGGSTSQSTPSIGMSSPSTLKEKKTGKNKPTPVPNNGMDNLGLPGPKLSAASVDERAKESSCWQPSDADVTQFWTKIDQERGGYAVEDCSDHSFSTLKDSKLEITCHNGSASYWSVPGYKSRGYRRDWPSKQPYRDGGVKVDGEFTCAFCGGKTNCHLQNVKSPKVAKSSLSRLKNDTNNLKIVLVILDGCSRPNFYRRMPKATEALKHLQQSGHTVVDFTNLNVVGYNSRPNQVPLFSGKTCKPPPKGFDKKKMMQKERHDTSKETMADTALCSDEPVPTLTGMSLWRFLGGKGYVTVNGDTGNCGLEFDYSEMNHKLSGDIFCRVNDGQGKFGDLRKKPFNLWYSGTNPCAGQKGIADHMVDYIMSVANNYKDHPIIMTTDWMDSHEDTQRRVARADDAVKRLIGEVEKRDSMENTVLVLMADHGVHLGVYYNKWVIGEREHRNPLMVMSLPPSLTSKYPDIKAAIESHKDTRLTPYDIYSTLSHLATYPSLPDNIPASAISVLDSNAPTSRSCKDAKIPKEWCNCFNGPGSGPRSQQESQQTSAS